MKTFKQYSNYVLLSMLFVLTIFTAGCSDNGGTALVQDSVTPPTVLSTAPISDAISVSRNTNITAFFTKDSMIPLLLQLILL